MIIGRERVRMLHQMFWAGFIPGLLIGVVLGLISRLVW